MRYAGAFLAGGLSQEVGYAAERSLASAERGRTKRAAAPEPREPRAGGGGGTRQSRVDGGRWGDVHRRGPGGRAPLGGCRRAAGGALQSGGAGGRGAAPSRRAAGAL